MENIIVYRNRMEAKLLTVVCGIVWGVLYAITTVGDILSKNPVFWHNQKCVWLMGFVFAIPVLIISRFRIIFDFNNRTTTHIGYFSHKKRYSFDEVIVSVSKRDLTASRAYVFSTNNQKLFQISEIDFEAQTHESVNYLKELFKGEEKFLYDIERSVGREGYHVTIYTYALTETILSVRGELPQYWINVGFNMENGKFSVQVWKDETTYDSVYKEKLAEEAEVAGDSLESAILELAGRYLTFG